MKESSSMDWKYAVLVAFSSLLATVASQSTSSQPPGYYAGYLNRYTKEDQCVYSFVVPKKDRDQCPGLKSTVEHMKTQIDELVKKQEQTQAIIGVLQDNKNSWHKIGELEAQVSQMEREKSQLVSDVSRLQAEKDSIENRRTQLEIELQDTKSQLQELNARYQPLSVNHTQLKQDFQRRENEMNELRLKFDKLSEEHKTLQRAKNCSSINKHLPSCAAIKQWGYTKSGYSMIDPDGEGGVEPFLVYCDMDSDPSTGISVVEHDQVKNALVQGCDGPGCFTKSIDYKGISISQITKLIDNSIHCEQFIKYDCFDSKLLKDGTGWWVSRNGRRMSYWGGASPGSNSCACGETRTCVDPNEMCNCDADSESWLKDEGYLRDKNALPVTQLRFGDVSKERGEIGKATLEALKCKWDVNMPVPSCDALRIAGVTQSGDYMVDPDGISGPTQPVPRTCDLGTPINPNRPVIESGVVPLESGISTPNNPFTSKTNQSIPQFSHITPLQKLPNKNMYQFTSCGQLSGRLGPTGHMCNFTYQYTNVRVSVVDGMQHWTVPKSGRYRMVAKAPAGQQYVQSFAGRGAVVRGEFKLRSGVQLKIIVGQKGSRVENRPFYGGSGGTFVFHIENWIMEPLLIAGGGGSAAGRSSPAKQSITDASLDMNGKDASKVGEGFGHGGTDGHGGERGFKPAGVNTPGGGAGIQEDGTASGDHRWGTPLPAKAFRSIGKGNNAPGVGGHFSDSTGNIFDGGFGGGGSAASYTAGGGGGYSGGGGGPDEGYSGGGGSYVNKNRGASTRIEVTNDHDGHLHIEWLGPAPELEQPTAPPTQPTQPTQPPNINNNNSR